MITKEQKKLILSNISSMLDEFAQEQIEKEQQPKLWPQVGDEYWFMKDYGDTLCTEYADTIDDKHRLATGNCFRTEAEALAYREWQTDPRVVARGMIERMKGFDPTGRFEIRGGNGAKAYVFRVKNGFWGSLTFSNEKAADKILEAYPDLCKVALGIITDKEKGARIVREAMGK